MEVLFQTELTTRCIVIVIVTTIILLLLCVKKYRNLYRKKYKKIVHLIKGQEIKEIDNLINSHERELDRIAKEIHDNLGSKTATLKLYLEHLENLDENDKTQQKKIQNILKELINNIYNEVRKIAHSKTFVNYIEKGLIASTEIIADQISSSNKLKIKVLNIDCTSPLEKKVEIQIFRCIQEILTNIIKHSKASEVIIQFSEDSINLNILIEDNGVGFDLNKVKDGIGLINIKQRIKDIHGKINIDSFISNGTTIILNIPLWK
ncbi:sensor histidine kinase [Polaribacter aquimarinus]|uniref:histidine kinase n=1 Tax=Polaribacter aquimarinus TaxID=2100726 RepID=A0A2U2JBE6_9FLAO|nr:sensor histidine kinase [Polaribacter aquimarinus]PWG05625.1 hypothetical protein DIS07_04050 [Polaribacter aquimarinus]